MPLEGYPKVISSSSHPSDFMGGVHTDFAVVIDSPLLGIRIGDGKNVNYQPFFSVICITAHPSFNRTGANQADVPPRRTLITFVFVDGCHRIHT